MEAMQSCSPHTCIRRFGFLVLFPHSSSVPSRFFPLRTDAAASIFAMSLRHCVSLRPFGHLALRVSPLRVRTFFLLRVSLLFILSLLSQE